MDHHPANGGKELAGCFCNVAKVQRACKSGIRRDGDESVIFRCYKHLNNVK